MGFIQSENCQKGTPLNVSMKKKNLKHGWTLHSPPSHSWNWIIHNNVSLKQRGICGMTLQSKSGIVGFSTEGDYCVCPPSHLSWVTKQHNQEAAAGVFTTQLIPQTKLQTRGALRWLQWSNLIRVLCSNSHVSDSDPRSQFRNIYFSRRFGIIPLAWIWKVWLRSLAVPHVAAAVMKTSRSCCENLALFKVAPAHARETPRLRRRVWSLGPNSKLNLHLDGDEKIK